MSIKNVLKKYEESGIRSYEISEVSSNCGLLLSSENEFFRFVLENNLNNIFYIIFDYNIEDYIITEDMYSNFRKYYKKSEYKQIIEKIQEHNKKVMQSEIFKKEVYCLLTIKDQDKFYFQNIHNDLDEKDEAIENITYEFD